MIWSRLCSNWCHNSKRWWKTRPPRANSLFKTLQREFESLKPRLQLDRHHCNFQLIENSARTTMAKTNNSSRHRQEQVSLDRIQLRRTGINCIRWIVERSRITDWETSACIKNIHGRFYAKRHQDTALLTTEDICKAPLHFYWIHNFLSSLIKDICCFRSSKELCWCLL